MKKLLLSIIILLHIGNTYAQVDDITKYTWYKFQYGSRMDRFMPDKMLYLPYRDSAEKGARPGAFIKFIGDGKIYQWENERWNLFGGSSGIDRAELQDTAAAIRSSFPVLTNLATASLTANGNYSHNWANYQLIFNNISDLGFFTKKTWTGGLDRYSAIGTQVNQGLQFESYLLDPLTSSITSVAKLGIGYIGENLEGVTIQSTNIMGVGAVLSITKEDTPRVETNALLRVKGAVEVHSVESGTDEDSLITWSSSTKRLNKRNSNNLTRFVTPIEQSEILAAKPIICWGNSLTEGATFTVTANPVYSYPLTLERISGKYVVSRGYWGQTSVFIRDKFLLEPDKYTWPTIIWIAFNDLLTDSMGAMTRTHQLVDSLIAHGNNKYLILQEPVSNIPSSWIGTVGYNRTKWFNDSCARAFGDHFALSNDYLLTLADPAVAQDAIDVANGVVPGSLRVDITHLNKKGYDTLARYIWTNHRKYLTADTLNKSVKEYDIYDLLDGKSPGTFTGQVAVRNYQKEDVWTVDADSRRVIQTVPRAYSDTATTLVNNGDFSSGTSWTTGGNWTIASNKATHSTGNTTALTQGVPITTSRKYYVEFTVTDRTTGSVSVTWAGIDVANGLATTSNAISANGTYRGNISWGGSSGTQNLNFTPTTDFNGSISNVKINLISMHTKYNGETVADTSYFTKIQDENIAIGLRPLNYLLPQGRSNSVYGFRAGDELSIGSMNSFFGYRAGSLLMDGGNNVAVGANAMSLALGGYRNTAVGPSALQNGRGSLNTAIGNSALLNMTGYGVGNVAIGDAAMTGTGGMAPSTNTAVGQQSLSGISGTAFENLGLGTFAGQNVNGGRRNTAIGHSTAFATAGGSFQLNISNNIFGTGLNGSVTAPAGLIGIGTAAPVRLLHTEILDAGTNTVVYTQRMSHNSSGTVTTGFGVGKEWALENASGTMRVVGQEDVVLTDPANATEDVDRIIKLIVNGALAEVFRFRGSEVNTSVPFVPKQNIRTRIRTITGNATLDDNDCTILIDASGGNVTVTLPLSATANSGGYGVSYTFVRLDNSGNTVSITRAGSDTINGNTSMSLTAQYQTRTIQAAGGTAWYITQ